MGKYYAIKEGFDFSNNKKIADIVVTNWNDCQKYIKGVKGAKYKSFTTEKEALEYLNNNSVHKKGDGTYPMDCLHFYVDGSFNTDTNLYSYGLVAVLKDTILYTEANKSADSSQSGIRQIAGELQGAVRAATTAVRNKVSKIVIFHDYEGVAHHATGLWDRKDVSSINYYNTMQKIMSNGLEIVFVKVDAHTGDIYNEIADELCKIKLGIKSDRVVDKYLESNTLKVASKKVICDINSITINKQDKLILVGSNKEKPSTEPDAGVLNESEIKSAIIRELNSLPEAKLQNVLSYIKFMQAN
ncbi:ribonuclease H family protein [Clostridium tertium]|uniref:ribonuclease H family protein n=1 Tax=Clostridium tertium TaxID=1559 RepID=UPI0023B2E798|nr:ribonuclease H family protein [Clostridium tertium]